MSERHWSVWVDDSPVEEGPLTARQAVYVYLGFIEDDDPGLKVEIRQDEDEG